MLGMFEALWCDWPGESRFGVQVFGCLLTLERVDAFLGGGLDVDPMARSVDPRLHRQKAARSA